MYQVILYYNFTPIPHPAAFCLEHTEKCKALGLKGRVYISPEGINGTLAGLTETIELYKQYLRGLPGFAGTEFKADECGEQPFYKLIVRVRPETVTLKVDVKVTPGKGGRHLSPHEWRQTLESGEDFVLLDVRNHYETRIGHFDGAITPELENFYEFPAWLAVANIPRDKKVLMYCTGGIRCEKFSVLMKEKGFADVNQLTGGILNYAKEEKGAHFKGKCFVFDDRLAVPVNPQESEPVSRCEISGVPCDTYLNCANMECNRLFLCSEEAAVRMEGCCSEECKSQPGKRPFDAERIYSPFRKWYHYFSEKVKHEGGQHA